MPEEKKVVELVDKPKIKPVFQGDYSMYVHTNNDHVVQMDIDTPLEELKDSAKWVNVANKFRPGDKVIVLARDYSWRVELMVRYVNGSHVNMAVLSEVRWEENIGDVDDMSDFEVTLMGVKKWVIRDKKSGEIKAEGIASKAQAYKQLEELESILSR